MHRKSLFALSALSVIVMLFSTSIAEAQSPDKPERKSRKTEKPAAKKDKFAIIKVGTGDTAQFKIVTMTALNDEMKRAKEQYAEQVRAYQKAQKEARKNKQKFTEPKPTRPAIAVLARNIASEEGAKKKMEELKSRDGKSSRKPAKQPKRKDKKEPPRDDDDGESA